MKQLSLVPRNDYEWLMADLEKVAIDAEKFYHKGNNAAGLRLRKAFRQIEIQIVKARRETTKLEKQRELNKKNNG